MLTTEEEQLLLDTDEQGEQVVILADAGNCSLLMNSILNMLW
jgi:hypothetical protein